MANKVIIEIINNSTKHISTNNCNKCFCGQKKDNKIRVEDYENMSDHGNLCSKCLNRYQRCLEVGVISKIPTVKCQCYQKTDDGMKKCKKVISAYEARELKHPKSPNTSEPVCSECYKLIKSIESNSVTTKYENAKPWLSTTNESASHS